MINFNTWLWSVINGFGWWWYSPCIILAVANLVILSRLDAPTTKIGLAARGFAWLAHLPWFLVGVAEVFSFVTFIPVSLNALGPLSLPLMLVANNILYTQLWRACRAEKQKVCPSNQGVTRNILNTMIQ